MAVNKPVPRISVDKLYAAVILSDDVNGTTYDTPVWLQGVNTISYDPATQTSTYDADGGTYVSYSADGASTATITVADLLPENYALLMGLQQDPTNGMITEGAADNAPEVALGFRTQKSNGAYRFIWILKGKFAKGQESYTTKGGSGVTFSPQEITLTAEQRISDGEKRHRIDSDDAKFPVGLTVDAISSDVDGWFSSPNYVPAAPGTPISDLVATTGAGDAGTIDLTFSAPTGATEVRVQANVFGTWVDVSTAAPITAASTTATITGLVAGNSYTVRLLVISGAKNGASNEETAAAKGA